MVITSRKRPPKPDIKDGRLREVPLYTDKTSMKKGHAYKHEIRR